jgi:hypothetical protein
VEGLFPKFHIIKFNFCSNRFSFGVLIFLVLVKVFSHRLFPTVNQQRFLRCFLFPWKITSSIVYYFIDCVYLCGCLEGLSTTVTAIFSWSLWLHGIAQVYPMWCCVSQFHKTVYELIIEYKNRCNFTSQWFSYLQALGLERYSHHLRYLLCQ